MKDRKSFFEVTEQVAKDLPEGYELEIRLEKNSGTVALFDTFGDEVDLPSNRERLEEEVLDALAFAVEQERENQGINHD